MKLKNIFLIAGIAFAALIFIIILTTPRSSTLSATFYDKDGKPIGTSYSIVSGYGKTFEGVASMDFTASVTNNGELPLTVRIDSATPAALRNALPVTSLSVAPGETKSWKSTAIQVSQFNNLTQNFYVKVKADYTYANQQGSIYKEGTLSYSFDADPLASATLDFISSVGGSEAGVEPQPGNTTNPTKKTSGTSCNFNEECQSNLCQGASYTISGPSSCASNPLSYMCSSANNCLSCDCSNHYVCNGDEAPTYRVGCQSTMTCESSIRVCA